MNAASGSSQNQPRISRHSRQQSANSPPSTKTDHSLHHRSQSDADGHLQKDKPVVSASKLSNPILNHSTDLAPEKALLSRGKESHSSPNVVHSLLRGTQEGWSGLDDETTAETLRKLDGISGKGARSRGSIGFFSRSSNHSRPSSPGSRGNRSDDAEATEKQRHASEITVNVTSARHKDTNRTDTLALDKDPVDIVVLPKGGLGGETEEEDAHPSGPELREQAEAKHQSTAVRSSLTAKRSSVLSANHPGAVTPGLRDSVLSSVSTHITSPTAASNRTSLKAKRSSTGSDVSSVNSSDAHKDKNFVASYTSSEGPENSRVPPVPPLPKDLSSYRTPPQSTTSTVFAPTDSLPRNDGQDRSHIKPVIDQFTNRSPDSTSATDTFGKLDYPGVPELTQAPALIKSPSKKWSFSNALNLRRSASPSRRDPHHTKSPASSSRTSLTSKQLRPSSSKGSPFQSALSPKSSVEAWQTIRDGAMNSETSLVSLSSLSSLPEPSPPISPAQDSGIQYDFDARAGSRADTESSASAGHAISFDQQSNRESPRTKPPPEMANKRLTPSSIPFFRRSSSQSMHMSPSHPGFLLNASPTFSSAPDIRHPKQAANSSSQDLGMPSSVPAFSQRKSSMLSLGFPSLLKGSGSKKSIQSDKGLTVSRSSDKAKKSKESDENLKASKDEKDRSESRISVLMGRKRGKVSIDHCLGSFFPPMTIMLVDAVLH